MRLETLIIFPVGKNSYEQNFDGKGGPEVLAKDFHQNEGFEGPGMQKNASSCMIYPRDFFLAREIIF